MNEQPKYKPAAPSPLLLARGLEDGKYLRVFDDLHRLCAKCEEYWPADTEFFYANPGGDGLNRLCRACDRERRERPKAATAASTH